MSIEKVLEFSFGLFKRDPKVVLPNVLNWIPLALLYMLLLQGANVFSKWVNLEIFQQILSNRILFMDVIDRILFYVVIGIPIVIASVIISLILLCVYSEITRQAYTKKKILLTEAFSVAKSKFLPLLWTYFLEFLIVILTFLLLIPLAFIGGIVGIIFTITAGFVVIFLYIIFFYETPAIVVFENKSGLEAIKRSYIIAKRNFWSLAIIVLIVGITVNIVLGSLASVPYIGLVLYNLAELFLDTWKSMIPSLFYYEYEKGRKKFNLSKTVYNDW
jgi:hypothetical protein